MPIYEYECEACKESLEVIRPMDAPKPDKCQCGGRLQQKFSPFTIFMGKAPISFYRKFTGPNDGKKP